MTKDDERLVSMTLWIDPEFEKAHKGKWIEEKDLHKILKNVAELNYISILNTTLQTVVRGNFKCDLVEIASDDVQLSAFECTYLKNNEKFATQTIKIAKNTKKDAAKREFSKNLLNILYPVVFKEADKKINFETKKNDFLNKTLNQSNLLLSYILVKEQRETSREKKRKNSMASSSSSAEDARKPKNPRKEIVEDMSSILKDASYEESNLNQSSVLNITLNDSQVFEKVTTDAPSNFLACPQRKNRSNAGDCSGKNRGELFHENGRYPS